MERRGRGDQVQVLKFCQGQWESKRRGRQRQKLGPDWAIRTEAYRTVHWTL